MKYEHIYQFQKMGYDLEQAEALVTQNIHPQDSEAVEEWEESERNRLEREADLVERGFLLGTDDPNVIARIEAQEAFDDRLAMYMNEY